jgi:aldehyde dehydrogenase (NAD+)
MRPESAGKSAAFLGTSALITRVPKGTCLIITPWNYPVNITLGQLVSALAAGNTVVLKPSEHTPYTSALMHRMIAELFDESDAAVVEGSHHVAEKLLELPFNHIAFTGSVSAGQMVMRAAAAHMSSVTLELGGKSPCYVHHDAAIGDASEKIAAAKMVNAGQSCVAPDYILAHHDIAESLAHTLKKSVKRYYDKTGDGSSPYFASIINDIHYNRLSNLVQGFVANEQLRSLRIMEPAIIANATPEHPAMKDEIFGPLLPVIPVQHEAEAIRIIHSIPEPLTVSVYARDRGVLEVFRKETRSGTLSFNESALHYLNPHLPFGGSGRSGIGRLHGKAGFMAFSDERVIFMQRTGLTMAKLLYPPYGRWKKLMVEFLLKYM